MLSNGQSATMRWMCTVLAKPHGAGRDEVADWTHNVGVPTATTSAVAVPASG